MKPYSKFIQRCFKSQILDHRQTYHSLEFTSNSGDLVYDSPEIISCALDPGLYGLTDGGFPDEVESGGG